ncbi:hypothetical protein EMIHUDRAFT_229964 [Emiliania huxleyi CCMP1516]|uniref:Uncharacterized protein n=2 Tax=Emiliania huxleyi TaxID=2903 RepID=A0A0D3KB80_EMIH1|nr:hypothetical protein EMIHUDRAFT_229964 [Emiliania huxleyi CCMP1516]EOD33015.1 hypothetical protein EMIHUDRAFT_229964 [Emiliania huxleyi CCMP1516]|eukprot:XP_005785444.1 hypothetical protein EMIHUDRAFT_229964 [Emiliania huxleyi CCMP1516]
MSADSVAIQIDGSRHAGGRLYKFEDFFDAPKLIPRKPGDIPCAVKALTSRPKASVVESVRSMHAELRTEVPPAWSDAGKLAIHCNNFSARRALVVLHLRTGWADVSANAAEVAPHNLQDCQLRERSWFDAADQVFSLMLAPNFGNLAVRDRLKNESLCAPTLRMASRPCGFAPTLTRLLENRAVAHLRQMGITAAHSHGQVGHNNAWATARIFDKDAALRVIDTALVDLLLLSHADMVVTSAGFSTFPKAADMMSGARALASALRVNGVLKNLDLGENEIGDEGAKAIGGALAVNGVLTTLNLANNQIRDQGAAAIAEALRGNGVLTELQLGANYIGGEGAKALASALRVNGVLTSLNLQNNFIRDEGATAIAEALQGNAVLTSLDVSYNSLTEEAALGIVRVERQRNKLTSLGLSRCSIGPTGAAEIAEYVSGSGVLKNIDLSYNSLGDEGRKAIHDAVSGREGFELLM